MNAEAATGHPSVSPEDFFADLVRSCTEDEIARALRFWLLGQLDQALSILPPRDQQDQICKSVPEINRAEDNSCFNVHKSMAGEVLLRA